MKKNKKKKSSSGILEILGIIFFLKLLYDCFLLGQYPNPITITAFICLFFFVIYKISQKFYRNIKKKKLNSKNNEDH